MENTKRNHRNRSAIHIRLNNNSHTNNSLRPLLLPNPKSRLVRSLLTHTRTSVWAMTVHMGRPLLNNLPNNLNKSSINMVNRMNNSLNITNSRHNSNSTNRARLLLRIKTRNNKVITSSSSQPSRNKCRHSKVKRPLASTITLANLC